jgi:ribosome biogenesis protein ERB1
LNIAKGKPARKIDAKMDGFEFEWKEGHLPLSAAPRSKKQFLPSIYERKKINRLVKAIRLGLILIDEPAEKPLKSNYDLWERQDDGLNRALALPPQRRAMPGHEQSYNPSEEFLLDAEELRQIEENPDYDQFIPRKFDSLRKVGAYENLTREYFQRCLNLFLLPRLRKKKLDMDPKDLLPKLPSPQELQPFPSKQNFRMKGHESQIKCLVLSQDAQFIASIDFNGKLLIFEV